MSNYSFIRQLACTLFAVLAMAQPSCGQGPARASLLDAIKSPIILKGGEHTAYRDPLLAYENGVFYLFYAYVREEEDHLIYWYVAESTSHDLAHWSAPRTITPKGQDFDYSSPGSLIKVNGEWIICFQTYPQVGMHRGDPLRFGDNRARLFTSRSRDLNTWGRPELIRVKGPTVSEADMGAMIDPFLMRDKDVKGRWLCFYKQGQEIFLSTSIDLKVWTPTDITIAHGENPDVIVDKNDYVLFYAPTNGIGVKRSSDLKHWREDDPPITLGQEHWPWAETRLTAGYVADMRKVPGVGKYVMVCHSMGPGKKKTDANVNANCNIVIAWSDDLKTWHWPAETS